MDIGPLWHAGTPVAFEHPTGYVAPALHDRTADGGTAFERILSGFLVTGGLLLLVTGDRVSRCSCCS